jgi:hypothetical protein
MPIIERNDEDLKKPKITQITQTVFLKPNITQTNPIMIMIVIIIVIMILIVIKIISLGV